VGPGSGGGVEDKAGVVSGERLLHGHGSDDQPFFISGDKPLLFGRGLVGAPAQDQRCTDKNPNGLQIERRHLDI